MFIISRQFDFCYGHRLLGHSGKCRHLHGHNGVAVIKFESRRLDEHGMVLDFAEIKRVVEHWLDENLDHRMILERTDPAVRPLQALGEPLYLLDSPPTAENIARLIFQVVADFGLPVVEVQLWETAACCAVYRRDTAET